MGLEKTILAAMASPGFPEYLRLENEWVKEDRAVYPGQQPAPPSSPAAVGSIDTCPLVALQSLLESSFGELTWLGVSGK